MEMVIENFEWDRIYFFIRVGNNWGEVIFWAKLRQKWGNDGRIIFMDEELEINGMNDSKIMTEIIIENFDNWFWILPDKELKIIEMILNE